MVNGPAAVPVGLILLLLLAAVVVLFTLWQVPRRQIARADPSRALPVDRRMELEDRARATLAQVLGGTFFLVTAFFTWQGIVTTREQLKLATAQLALASAAQTTDRFTRAVEQLNAVGAGNETRRLAAVFSLERIARETGGEDHAVIVEILAGYVRRNAPEQGHAVPPDDVQAAVRMLGRRHTDRRTHPERGPLDLHGTSLRQAALFALDLRGVMLYGSDLTGADLNKADLRQASLQWNAMQGAKLRDANLAGADLRGVDLTGAVLTQAQLDTALTDSQTKVSPPLRVNPRLP